MPNCLKHTQCRHTCIHLLIMIDRVPAELQGLWSRKISFFPSDNQKFFKAVFFCVFLYLFRHSENSMSLGKMGAELLLFPRFPWLNDLEWTEELSMNMSNQGFSQHPPIPRFWSKRWSWHTRSPGSVCGWKWVVRSSICNGKNKGTCIIA